MWGTSGTNLWIVGDEIALHKSHQTLKRGHQISMKRRERFFFIASVPLLAASVLIACSDDDPRPTFEETPDAGGDSIANLPEASPPLDDAGVRDARVPFDASDEPVVCTAKPCVTQLVGGGSHFCALLDDKTVRCWGSAYQALGIYDGGGNRGTSAAESDVDGALRRRADHGGEHDDLRAADGRHA